MTATSPLRRLRDLVSRLSAQALALAAVGAALDTTHNQRPLSADLERAVRDLLATLEVEEAVSRVDARDARALLAEIRVLSATHGQLLQGAVQGGWTPTDPSLVQAAGDATARFAHALKDNLGSELEGLLPRLNAPGARFLDVGCGVAALSIEMARVFPELKVVGVDVHEPALAQARVNVRRAGLESRVELRAQSAELLRDEDSYDLVWIPGLFISSSAMTLIFEQVAAALRNGGHLLCVALKEDGDGVTVAAARLRTALWGGSLFTPANIETLLLKAGFSEIKRLPSAPANATQLVAARKRADTQLG